MPAAPVLLSAVTRQRGSPFLPTCPLTHTLCKAQPRPAHTHTNTHVCTALSRRIDDLEGLLASRERILALVQREAEEAAAKHGTPRRTAIVTDGALALGGWEGLLARLPSAIVGERCVFLVAANGSL